MSGDCDWSPCACRRDDVEGVELERLDEGMLAIQAMLHAGELTAQEVRSALLRLVGAE